MKLKKYVAWTRNAEKQDSWLQSIMVATSRKEAQKKFEAQGREVEPGTLKLSKYQ
jgi:hypothetical protein